MKIDLCKRRVRYIRTSESYAKLFKYSNDKEQHVVSSGVLNFIWNGWNNFWRDYWVCHVSGGIDFRKNPVYGPYPSYNDKQCCHFLLHKLRKIRHHNYGDAITGSYQEATWGDPKIIQKIAIELNPHYPNMTNLLATLSLYQRDIEHFQKIRNAFIHFNKDNVKNLNAISGYYIFSGSQRAIDILNSTSTRSSMRCFDHLNAEMRGFLLNI